jgi:hypothetical protein
VEALSRAVIPHMVTGGYAAQEYGCLRYTDNVDLIVPDIPRALAALRGSGFPATWFFANDCCRPRNRI